MVEGESMRPAAPGSYYHIVSGGEMIGGVPPAAHRAPGIPSHWMIYFQVGDCDGTIAKVTSLGGRVVVPAMTMENVRRFAVLSDPQGAMFAIVQSLEAPRAQSAPKAAAADRPATSKPAPTPKPAPKPASPRQAATARKATPARRTKPARKAKSARKAGPTARNAKPAARKAGKPRRSVKAKPARRSRKAGKAKK
jgi:predicted enzyme related to lactoylglutathione lyase